ncbi:GNAT family N-acetyltransferase [Paenibacillus sp. CC-CFT747]|nr:GNAT family N-acetyltransferase [Paenibacillus sp. CC-CFT747]
MLLEPVSADRIDDLVKLWNEEWGSSFPMREALMIQNVLGDPNLLEEGTRVAIDEDSNRVIGLVVSKQWREKRDGLDFGTESGWIHSLLVSGSFRRQGLGNLLLELAEDALLNNGVRQVHLGNDFHRRMFPGVPETNPETMLWLERRGYVRQAEVMDLYRDDEKAEPEPLPEGNGVTFRLAEESDAGELNAFLTRCFPGRWSYQTLHYWELGGTGREFVIAEREG